jgi:starch phosphorylase
VSHAAPLPPSSTSWSLDDIGRLASVTGNAAETLSNVVQLIQRRFGTDVCSVYLLGPDRSNLVLAATVGLKPDSVGRIRMRLDEGLVGLVAEELQPVIVDDAPAHPRFKYFKDAGEDPYRSFLGVPLIDRGLLQGVLVVQTVASRAFDASVVAAIGGAGHQLSHVVSLARTQGQFVAPTQERLRRLASNLWWCWDADTTSLFRDLDPGLWRRLGHNPVALLQQLPVSTIDERASQLSLHGRINYAYRRLEEYLGARDTWGERHAGVLRTRPVAYFSAEFGLHESLPIYSGGLGILSGDHIKAASDLGIPLVGVGLFYDQGYFRQRLDREMCQQEEYLDLDAATMPIRPATTKGGQTVTVTVETRTGPISARVWTVPVGRSTLLLLDSDVEGNPPEDRELTARLYGGDERARIRQELLLGVGGARALRALGYNPGVAHLNEGHSAFAALEFARQRMEREGLSAHEALRLVASHIVFTTHTPVPAGHDRFSPDLVEEHLGPLREALGLDREGLLAWGRLDDRAGAEAVAPRQCGFGVARARVPRDVDRPLPGRGRGAGADRPHHQRRPRAHLARRADASSLRPPPRHRLAEALRRSGIVGSDRPGRGRRAVGDAPDAADAHDRVRAAARRGIGGQAR